MELKINLATSKSVRVWLAEWEKVGSQVHGVTCEAGSKVARVEGVEQK